MQVEVSGTLEGLTSNIRQKAKRIFKFPVERQPATTLVSFGGRNNPYKSSIITFGTTPSAASPHAGGWYWKGSDF